MRKFLKRILILFVLLVLVDFFVGIFLGQILNHSTDGRYFKAKYSLERCNEDLIIFGSSRAETNYAPFVFEDSLNISCWNTGRGGQTIPFWYAMEKGILSRYTPKIAIVNVERDFLVSNLNINAYERAGFLRPFYSNHSEIRPIINMISHFEFFLMYSNTYAFNSSFYYLLRPYFIKGLDGKKQDKGWKTLNTFMLKDKKLKLKTIQTSENNLNYNTVKLFEEFIISLIKKGCKVYVVLSPNYGYIVESTSSIEYIKSMKDVVFINLGNKSFFSSNHNFYKDPNHFNITGAIEYSKKLSSIIINHENTAKNIEYISDIINKKGESNK